MAPSVDPDLRRRLRGPSGWAAGLTIAFIVLSLLPKVTIFSSTEGYVPLHTVPEFASMGISLMVFALAWNVRGLEANSQIMVLGLTSLAVLLLDVIHTLSFPGMPDLVTPSGMDKTIAFWLAGRLIAAIGLLVVALVPLRHWSDRIWIPAVLLTMAAVAVLWWIGLYHLEWLPRTFTPEEGLTTLKKAAEYTLSGMYALAAILLARRAWRSRILEIAWLAAAAWTLTLAELSLTLYADVTDIFNLMGHLLKVIAYVMIYRAIFVAGAQDPYLRLRRETSLLRTLIDSLPDRVSFTDRDGRYAGANAAFPERAGLKEEDVLGQPAPQGDEGPAGRFEEVMTDTDGVTRAFDTLRTPYYDRDGAQLGVIEVSRDVTAQKEAEERIEHLALHDQLTGLPNRFLLNELIERTLRDPRWTGRPPMSPRGFCSSWTRPSASRATTSRSRIPWVSRSTRGRNRRGDVVTLG